MNRSTPPGLLEEPSRSAAANSGAVTLPPAGNVVVLSPGLSDVMTGMHELQNQVSSRVAEHLELVRKGEETLGSAPLPPLTVETWQSMERTMSTDVDILIKNNPSTYNNTQNVPYQFVDSNGGSHSLFEVLLEVARLHSSLASGIGILTGSHPSLDARSETPTTLGFGIRFNSLQKLSTSPIAWCGQSEVHLQDYSSLESAFSSLMQLRSYGFMEFLTGGVVMLGSVRGDSAIIPVGRLRGLGNMLTGFELLAHIARTRGHTRPCTDLLSPILSDTWIKLHAERGLNLAEQSALSLPFEYSRDLHRHLLLKNSGFSNSQIGVTWGHFERGLHALALITRPLSTQHTSVPVVDYLGRELWPSLGGALNFLREESSKERQHSQSESQSDNSLRQTVRNQKVAEKVRKLID